MAWTLKARSFIQLDLAPKLEDFYQATWILLEDLFLLKILISF